MKGLNETFQADLVEMIPYKAQNRNFKYILTVIDIFSKFAWAIPIKSKTAADVADGMKKVFASGRIPKNLHTDQGKEFFNTQFKHLMDNNAINHYHTFSTKKAAIVERFNRTLKGRMWKQFSMQGSYKWISKLQKLIDSYNNTKHRSIKMKPIDVTPENEKNLMKTAFENKITIHTPKFKLGDYVRISKYKSLFAKGYTPNWTTEIFRINKVRLTDPITYLLRDWEEKDISGGFYEYELQRVKYPKLYLVEKILKRKGDKVFVKWLGFSEKFNSWIDKNSLL